MSELSFQPAADDWLTGALSRVLATSLDPADQLAVFGRGAQAAATLLLSLATAHMEQQPDWWQLARSRAGEPVGFVLCSVFPRKGDQPFAGTIFYMGVLPEYRGKGYGRHLLNQATHTLVQIRVQRILCDTATCNTPMIAAFRSAGYLEKEPWERPLH